MDADIAQADLEYGPSRPSLHYVRGPGGLGGSTVRGVAAARPQPNDFAIEEKFSQDDMYARVQSPIIERVTNSPHRRDTSLVGQAHHDPSARIWELYLSEAAKSDKELSESVKSNADQLLVFLGLLSTTVAAFSLISYQQLQPSSSDTTNLLLSQISQQLSTLSNGTLTSASLTLPNQPSFRPTASAVRVNTLWFSSLAISMVSAVWVTIVQQWTRRYLLAVNRSDNPLKRARIRAFLGDGVEKFGLQTAIEILPSLMRFSVLLYFIGLVDFLLNVNRFVGLTLLSLFAIGALIYILLTVMPLYYPNSPFRTSLSSLIWFIIEVAPLLKLWLHRRTKLVRDVIRERQYKIRRGMSFALEKQADNRTSQVDAHALRWVLMSLDEDHELEDFLDGLPGLFQGMLRHQAQGMKPELERLVEPVADRLFATCATGLIPEGIRRQRLTACLGAIWCFPGTIERHFRAIRDQWTQPTNDPWGPLSIETWTAATNLADDPDPVTAIRAHCVQALIAAMWVNGKWQCPPSEAYSLLQRQLGVPSVVIDRWREGEGHHLQLAVAANLLSHVLPLLRRLDTGPDIAFKIDVKAILDLICGELVETDVPDDLRARFPNGSEVMEVFNIEDLPQSFRQRAAIDPHGPWTKIFTPV